MRYCILIPAYKPDNKLIKLIDELNQCKPKDSDIVLVDDGGGSDYADVFETAKQYGCTVLVHKVNCGKGAALKTGLSYAKQNNYAATVTADADGQHLAKDIVATLNTTLQNNDALTLGVRNTKEMPFNSKFGNRLTTWLFRALFGRYLCDTQTGLRGIPQKLYDSFIQLNGERYEYEMNMLVWCVKNDVPYAECTIDTVYIDDNASSHFKGIKDGLKIYALLLKQVSLFTVMSFCAFIIDFTLFALFNRVLCFSLLLSTLFARAVSSFANYLLNHYFVFKKGHKVFSFLKYYLLVGIILCLNYGIMFLFVNIFMWDSLIAKVITELGLYIFSFKMQQLIVFKEHKNKILK